MIETIFNIVVTSKNTPSIVGYFSTYIKISIHKFTGNRLKLSDAYVAIEAYPSANSSKSTKRLRTEIGKDNTNLVLSMDEYKKVTDELCGAKVWWVASNVVAPSWPMGYYPEQEKSYCQLTVHKRYLEMITCVCLEHVVKEEKELRVRNRQRKLYTNSPDYKWPS
ncbi:hypothetical protein V6N13_070532 [Hibiscus sabdariffa]